MKTSLTWGERMCAAGMDEQSGGTVSQLSVQRVCPRAAGVVSVTSVSDLAC